jgi:hypothetical protein
VRRKGTYPSTFEGDILGLVGSKGCESDTKNLLDKHAKAMNYYKNQTHTSSPLACSRKADTLNRKISTDDININTSRIPHIQSMILDNGQ